MTRHWLCRMPFSALVLTLTCLLNDQTLTAEEFVPRRQSRVPGPPLSPEAALKKFTVHDGFHVELVAAEPQIMNPVAMAFDDRGRIYVTESFEYPRQEPGPGRDRIKILEDTDRDGKIDSVKIFAEGLNIPSAIAVGHGGVWVANAPDLLFMEDTDGDDKVDKQTVVVTGFGRYDTHELPSAFTWGPDGYLYGLNGVFNPAKIEQDGKTFDFTCAMFRIDPRTKKFELFCEGTSNPWGIAFDAEGSAFISACVIDHLWHLTETGYYHRQGGPYPPHTWKAESIVKHQHQMAAYCGIEYFDSPAYPEKYRDKLYMGNIHGSCINVDRVERSGATYQGFGEDDFITADDVWFMPVAQKVGPDGCLYILDWYDRYHCYQDANADPKGVDRGHGRLYRVVFEKQPEVDAIDFSKLDNVDLVTLLSDANIYNRQQAQLKLSERRVVATDLSQAKRLASISLDEKAKLKDRMHATWALIGGGDVNDELLLGWMQSNDAAVRAWGARTVGKQRSKSARVLQTLAKLAADEDARVRIQVAIAAPKLYTDQTATKLLIEVLRHSGPDAILPNVVWQNLHPRLMSDQTLVVEALKAGEQTPNPLLFAMGSRIASRLISEVHPALERPQDQASVNSVLAIANALSPHNPDEAAATLGSVIDKAQTGELRGDQLKRIVSDWLATLRSEPATGSRWSQAIEKMKVITGDQEALARAEATILSPDTPADLRAATLRTAAIGSRETVSKALKHTLEQLLANQSIDEPYRNLVFDLGLATASQDDVALIARSLTKLDGSLQATLVERMSQRTSTAEALLEEIAAGRLRKEMVGPNQMRLLAQSSSPVVLGHVKTIWGAVQSKVSEQRQKVVEQKTAFLLKEARGDAKRGLAVYDRICGQCHLLHGRGYEVGPNITANGRGNFEQLIVSVFDPSLVIGEAYKSYTLLTVDGRVVNGLLVEQTPQRTVLRLQGNKLETIPADEIEQFKQNDKSLMPEGLEEQMTAQELADLFALLSLEGPIDAKDNRLIPGAPETLAK
jgi:putative membrane-bound dehydrogenase-like protein